MVQIPINDILQTIGPTKLTTRQPAKTAYSVQVYK